MIKKVYRKAKSVVKGAANVVKGAVTSAKGLIGAGSGVIGSATTALADTTTLDVPSIDTTILYNAGGVVFAGLAIIGAIIVGIRLYKRL